MSTANFLFIYKNKIKTSSSEIRLLKSLIKTLKRSQQDCKQALWELSVHQYGIRHVYLAYAIERGYDVERVEKHCKKELSHEQIDWTIKDMKEQRGIYA